jgi:PAS domain S-box-containing protein
MRSADHPGVQSLTGTAADAAERIRELTRSAAQLRHLVDQFPAVAYMLAMEDDESLRPVFVSPQSEEIMGVGVGRWEQGHHVLPEVHPDDRAAMARAYEEMCATGEPQTYEFRWTRPDGREIWLSDTGSVVCYATGERYLQGLIHDVTAAKEAEAERRRLELELRLSQKLEAVGQLASGIAHEINTPIQFVGDTISFLRDAFDDLLEITRLQADLLAQPSVPPELTRRAEDARERADLDYLYERIPMACRRGTDGIERVATIVRAMKAFSHPPAAEQAPVDLNAALRNTLIVAANEYRYVADVETDLGDLPSVVCNGGDINQLFLNLVVNAGHAIADRVGDSGERGAIRVRTRVEGPDVVISIADTGCGMPDDVAERAFDPFFTTKEVGRGTGQGLAMARTLVDRHRGALTFDTTPGVGTTFHVRLPVAGDRESRLR